MSALHPSLRLHAALGSLFTQRLIYGRMGFKTSRIARNDETTELNDETTELRR
jgi:hypothetical protein